MLKRSIPPVLIWLAGLTALAVVVAAAAGVVLYVQALRDARTQATAITSGDWKMGQLAVRAYGCGACHSVPGIAGANGKVGPDLAGIGRRTTIAGKLTNDPNTMVRWLMHPQRLIPGNGMPEQGVTERSARDMAAYLYAES